MKPLIEVSTLRILPCITSIIVNVNNKFELELVKAVLKRQLLCVRSSLGVMKCHEVWVHFMSRGYLRKVMYSLLLYEFDNIYKISIIFRIDSVVVLACTGYPNYHCCSQVLSAGNSLSWATASHFALSLQEKLYRQYIKTSYRLMWNFKRLNLMFISTHLAIVPN